MTMTDRVLAHLREEGGVWTAAGVAREIGLPPHSVSKKLQALKSRKLVRRVGERRTPKKCGRPAGLYEAA